MAQYVLKSIRVCRKHQTISPPIADFTYNQGGLILKSPLKIIAIIACVCSLAGTIHAQESGGGMVAVLDVAKVFEANTAFNSRMDAIKAEAQQFKTSMEQKQAELQQRAAPLKDYQPGSTEFNQLQAQLEQETASLRTQAQQTNTELLNREATIYFDTYNQLQSTVTDLAGQFNINLIIRFDSQPIDPANRGEVIKGVNRNIVYKKNLDLTSMVIEKMAGAGAGAGVGSSANQGSNLK